MMDAGCNAAKVDGQLLSSAELPRHGSRVLMLWKVWPEFWRIRRLGSQKLGPTVLLGTP